jgi:hypothetical protein
MDQKVQENPGRVTLGLLLPQKLVSGNFPIGQYCN